MISAHKRDDEHAQNAGQGLVSAGMCQGFQPIEIFRKSTA